MCACGCAGVHVRACACVNVGVHVRAQEVSLDVLHPLPPNTFIDERLEKCGLKHLADKFKGVDKATFDGTTAEDLESIGLTSAEIDIMKKSRSVSSHLDA